MNWDCGNPIIARWMPSTLHLILSTPERSPPTENGAEFHSYRVHLQVLQWDSFLNTDALPTDCGWKVESRSFILIATSSDPASEKLLHLL